VPVAERDYMAGPEPERDHWLEPERCWIMPPWAIVVGTIVFTIIFAVGGSLIDIAAFILGMIFFVLFCLALFAFLRWLFKPRC